MVSSSILHVHLGMSEKTLEEKIPDLVRRLTSEVFNFAFYQVGNLCDYQETEVGRLIGFNRKHLLPHISDPTGKIKGSVVIVGGKLVYTPNGIPLQDHRDSYLFNFADDKFYTTLGFIDIVEGFLKDETPMFFSDEMLLKTEQAVDFSKLEVVGLEVLQTYK